MPKQKDFKTNHVVLVSSAHLFHDTFSSFLAQALPILIDKFDISKTLAGLLSIVQGIPSLFNFLVGIMVENIKARYLVIFAPAVTSVAMSLIGVAPGYIFLVILLFISGISSALFHVPAPVMIKKLSGSRIGKGMSFFMLGGELARTLGPLVIVGVVSLWGLEGTYKLIPFGLAASVFLFIKLRKIDISSSFEGAGTKPEYWKIFKKFLPVFIAIGGIIFFRAAIRASLTLYLPVYITENGGEYWFSGVSLSVLQLAGALGTFYSGTISDKIGRKSSLLIITIASPLLMYISSFIQGFWTLPLLILLGIFLIASTPILLAVVHELETERLAFVNGVFMTINFTMGSLMVLLVGIASDVFGINFTYKASAFVGLIAIVFVVFLPGKAKR
ncbi:MAG: MFS transporter [Bacteroidetes bacterium]|nr:MFS transporter [Bacteroidota bacterium]